MINEPKIIFWICDVEFVSFWTSSGILNKNYVQYSLLIFLYSQVKSYDSKLIYIEVCSFFWNAQIYEVNILETAQNFSST